MAKQSTGILNFNQKWNWNQADLRKHSCGQIQNSD